MKRDLERVLPLVLLGLVCESAIPGNALAQGLGCTDPGAGNVATSAFTDVPTWHWAKGCIEKAATYGLMPGCGGSYFCPEAHVLREEMAYHILRGEHLNDNPPFVPPAATGTVFTDAPAKYCLSRWIERFYTEGFTAGCAPALYCSFKTLTRAEMAVFLDRAFHAGSFTPPPATGTVFEDVPASHWAAAHIEQIYRDGITAGCGWGPGGGRIYCPESTVTRAEMAVFLTRVYTLGGSTSCQ